MLNAYADEHVAFPIFQALRQRGMLFTIHGRPHFVWNVVMDYAEFWILETAVEAGAPFRLIHGPRAAIEAQWNKAYHHLSRPELLDLLDRLARDGDIVASDGGDACFRPTREQIDSWLVFDKPTANRWWCYFLTPQGGERWERFARADWDRFHSFEWDWDDEAGLEIAATTPEIAERAFQYAVRRNRLRVFPGTVSRHTLRPWTPTYWKTLAAGHAVRLRCEEIGSYEEEMAHFYAGMSEAELEETGQRLQRESQFFRNWYTRHPDTPRMGPVC